MARPNSSPRAGSALVTRRLPVLVAVLILASLTPALPAVAATVSERASLTDIESDLMCVACREPLAVAQSPQAYSERAFIRMLIEQGESKAQIEKTLVAQYGPAVLAKPPAHGFNLTVYILPPAVLLAGLATLAFTLPRWRRRTRERAAAAHSASAGSSLAAADARRLDEDLARYGS
jgi:cytochrome c-type biogenesis protein CcmH